MEDQVTILTCVSETAIATKTIRVDDDGTIITLPYRSGKKFSCKQKNVHDIWSLGAVINSLENEPKSLIIRGDPLETNVSKIVSRCGEGHEEAAFKDIGRWWMMIDIDDLPLPDFIDPIKDPEAAAKWARASLPKPFRKATCYYQFSSSQSLPKKIGEKPKPLLKIHLFFWLDKPTTSKEWRIYINE